MEVKEDGLYKPSDSERRLRLRKDYKESHLDDECKQNNTACTSRSQCDDDSILDFKTPKKMYSAQTKITNNNRHISKSKKKISHSKTKAINNKRKIENNKTSQNRKMLHDIQQPLIESSFFKSEETDLVDVKTADMKTAHVCPLCFKNFKDECSQAVHMKSCAIKNNISTKKLMVAVELQERQAAERKSLGLLSAPVLQEKKKPASRKAASHDDPDLQLALALSKSLYEKEEMEEWDEIQMMGISSPSLSDSNAEQSHKTTLQNFGFISDRNVTPTNNLPINKTKRKGKFIKETILQRRTAIDRERILTERIAEILMGCKDFTQRLQKEEEQSHIIKKKIVIKNRLLQQIHQMDNTLWDRTKLTSTNKNIFYIKQLLPQIISSKKKEQILNKEEDIIKHMDQSVSNGKSLQKRQMQEINGTETVEALIDKEESMVCSNALKTCCKEKRFLDIFVKSWENILNDSSASDIIVFVKNGKHIWAHKLVFYVRCANILLDVISNDTEFSTVKEKICWIDIDYDIALAFFEFIYCGVINRNSKILDIDTSLSSIRSLARKYKVNDLFAYLRQRKFISNKVAEVEIEDDYKTYGKCTENIDKNIETVSNILKLNESNTTNSNTSSNTTLNHTLDDLINSQCLQKAQDDINDTDINDTDIFENNRTSAEESYVSQENISTKSSNKIKSRNNTPTNFDFRASPDMFDDSPSVIKYSSTTTMYSKEQENSNIYMLLNLIKQDADVDNYQSQRSSVKKTLNAKYLKPTENTITCSKNIGQDVIEIDSDPESNSIKSSIDNTQKNSLNISPQSSKLNIPKQKSNLTLFIEKIQRENAKSDSDLDTDSDIECTVQISPMKRKNPFHIHKYISEDLQSDNIKQPIDTKKKTSRLSIIEHCIQSYANKNPEFYSHFSNEHKNDKQTDTLYSTSPKEMIESVYDDTLNYRKNFISSTEDSNFTKQVINTSLSTACLLPKIKSQFSNETISDIEENEAEISMYSKYMKNHKDNSIAKYRAIIKKNISDSDFSNKSALSNSINENNDIDKHENDEILTQKDADIIISSDTEIESISSNSIVLQNDDVDHENSVSHFMQQSSKSKKDNRQNIEYEENNQSINIPTTMTINFEEQKDIDKVIESNQDEINKSTESEPDYVDFNISLQNKYTLNKLHDSQKGLILNSITTFSNADFLNIKNQFSDNEHCNKFMLGSSDKLKEFTKYSNFKDDIYLTNIDIDKDEKQQEKHVLEKSHSTNVTKFKRSNARKCINKDNYENMKTSDFMDNIMSKNLDCNITSLTQTSTNIKKFKRKSLSEGQIDTKRLNNQETTFKHIFPQFQYNYNQNIGDTIVPKILKKDVTPLPNYDDMSTPELHKEMKKYGLKVQKRSRAVKLLSYIYNELHPLISTSKVITEQKITEISSDEENGPPLKKRSIEDNYMKKLNNIKDSDDELLCSQDSNSSKNVLKDIVSKEMEFYETESLPALENSLDIKEAFTKLINLDKDLYNKILQYEPINIENLHSTLRAHGFKYKLPNLMNFLDEQCITFYVPEQNSRNRIHRKK